MDGYDTLLSVLIPTDYRLHGGRGGTGSKREQGADRFIDWFFPCLAHITEVIFTRCVVRCIHNQAKVKRQQAKTNKNKHCFVSNGSL
jgi:hypothetical protein